MLRKLSSAERFMCLAGREEPLFFTMTARITGAFSLPALKSALHKARQKHPLTAVQMVYDANEQPWFEATEAANIPLRVIENGDDDTWLMVVTQELTTLVDPENDPLIRFVWIKGDEFSDLIIVCHHAVSDGFSAAFLMRDILTFLGKPETAIEPLPLLPPMEEMIPAEVEAALLPQVMAGLEEQMSAGAPPEMPQRESSAPALFELYARALTWEQTTLLVQRARTEETTVHGALGAAFLLAFADQFGESSGYTRTLQSPVDVRTRLAQPVGEDFGLFIHLLKTKANCSPGRDFWEIARAIKDGFIEQATDANLFQFALTVRQLLTLGIDFETLFDFGRNAAPLQVDYDLSLSNLGRLDFPEHYGRIQLTSLYGPTFSAAQGEKVAGVCTVNGRLTFTFIYRKDEMNTALAEAILDHTLQTLATAVGW